MSRFRTIAWSLAACFLAGTAPILSNDSVADLREAVDAPPRAPSSEPPPAPTLKASPAKKKHSPTSDPWQPSDIEEAPDLDGQLLWGFAALGGLALTSPVWIPGSLVNDGEMQKGWFTAYPYQHHDSYMTFAQPNVGDSEPWQPANYSLRLESDFGTDFNSQKLVGTHLLWEHTTRYGLEARLNYLEDNFSRRPDDSVFYGDLNGTYRFAQSHHWLFRGGIGANWLSDHGDIDLGPNFTYQMDWFPTEPLVFSTELDLGTLGDAWLFHFQQTAGVTWRGLEGRVGYDYLDVGDAQFSMFLCGVRGWF